MTSGSIELETVHKHLFGGPDEKKKKIITKFWGTPFRPQKFQGPPPPDMKIIDQPHRKSYKFNFHRKICGNFFQGPL